MLLENNTREVRIFLSSTFNDMQQERDYLIKKIFPLIKAECRRRDVDFTVLDLRWGITNEEAASGRVIEICLDEIERTKPYFIGLIGGRYGWVPDMGEIKTNQRLLQRYPWIEDDIHSKMSITEIEMRFGALRNPKDMNAFFYIKDAKAVDSRNADPVGSPAAKRREALKDYIVAASNRGEVVASMYKSVKQLGKQVYSDLMRMIDEQYPLPKMLLPLDRIYAEQQRRLSDLRQVYVDRNDNYLYELEESINDDKILMMVGSKGVGKSATIANLLPMSLCVEIGNLGSFEVVHTFIDGSVSNKDLTLRMLFHSLAKKHPEIDCKFINDFSESPNYKDLFAAMSKNLPPILWIIDGLENYDSEIDATMGWIERYRDYLGGIVFVTSESYLGRGTEKVLASDSIRVHNIYEYTPPQVSAVMNSYLRKYAKRLIFNRLMDVSDSALMQNGALLKIFMDELLQFGKFEKVDEFIDSYLSSSVRIDLCELVISRLENDFGQSLTRGVLVTLNLLTQGVDEDIFITELGLKEIEWVPVRAAIVGFSSFTNGIVKIIDKDFKSAIESRYHGDDHTIALAKSILRKTLRRYVRDEKSMLQQAVGFLLGDGLRFSISERDYMSEDVRHCVAQLLRLYVNSGDNKGVEQLIREKYFLLIKPADLQILIAPSTLPSFEINQSRIIRFIDFLFPDFVFGLYSFLRNTEQKDRLLKRIKRTLLPPRIKRKYIKMFSELEQYYNMPLYDLLDENKMSTLQGATTLLQRAKELLIFNNFERLDSILERCDKLLEIDSVRDTDHNALNLAGAFASMAKGDFDRVESYLSAIDFEGMELFVFFCRAKMALMQYAGKSNRDMSSLSYKRKTEDAVAMFQKCLENYGHDEYSILFTYWIREMSLVRGLNIANFIQPRGEVTDDNLWILGMGLYYDGIWASIGYLEQILNRPTVGLWRKHLAAYFVGCSYKKSEDTEKAIHYFEESLKYYREVEKEKCDKILFMTLAELYHAEGRFEEYEKVFTKIVLADKEEKYEGEFLIRYMNGLVRMARILAIQHSYEEDRKELGIILYEESEKLQEGSVCSMLIRLYLAIIDPEYSLPDGTFDNVVKILEDNNLQTNSIARDAVFDYMIFEGREKDAEAIEEKWCGVARKKSNGLNTDDKYHHPNYPFEENEEADSIEEAIALAIAGDGIHGEVDEMFRKIDRSPDAEAYVVEYLEGIMEYLQEMEMHEDRFMTKMQYTVARLRPYMGSKGITDLINEILLCLSSMPAAMNGSTFFINIAEMCGELGLETREMLPTLMGMYPWEGKANKTLNLYERYFADGSDYTVEYARILAMWQIGEVESAKKILHAIVRRDTNPFLMELYARILSDCGEYEHAAASLKEADKGFRMLETVSNFDCQGDNVLRLLIYTYSGYYQDAFEQVHELYLSHRIALSTPKGEVTEEDSFQLWRPRFGEYELIYHDFGELYRSGIRMFGANPEPGAENIFMIENNNEEDDNSNEEATEFTIYELSVVISNCAKGVFFLKVGKPEQAEAVYQEIEQQESRVAEIELLAPPSFAIVLFYAEYASYLISIGDFAAARRHLDFGKLVLSHLTSRSDWASCRLNKVDTDYQRLCGS